MAFKQGNYTVISDRGHLATNFPAVSSNPMKKTGDGAGTIYGRNSIGKNSEGQDVIFMSSALRTKTYRNGDPIITGLTSGGGGTWALTTDGAFCVYGEGIYPNTDNNEAYYGLLYNWHAVNDIRGIAPIGWHIDAGDIIRDPDLEIFYGGPGDNIQLYGGFKYLDPSLAGWVDVELDFWDGTETNTKRNASGMQLYAAGGRSGSDGDFEYMRLLAHLWCGEEGPTADTGRQFMLTHQGFLGRVVYPKTFGASVIPRKDPVCKDYDGNIYATITIPGLNQCWTMQNHRVSRFNNGDEIELQRGIDLGTSQAWIYKGMSGDPLRSYCSEWNFHNGDYENTHEDSPRTLDDYGYLYNGHAVLDSRGMAPIAGAPGWRMPTMQDWVALQDHCESVFNVDFGSMLARKYKQHMTLIYDAPEIHPTVNPYDADFLGWEAYESFYGSNTIPLLDTDVAGDTGMCCLPSGARHHTSGELGGANWNVWGGLDVGGTDDLVLGQINYGDPKFNGGNGGYLWDVNIGNKMPAGLSIRYVYDLPVGQGEHL